MWIKLVRILFQPRAVICQIFSYFSYINKINFLHINDDKFSSNIFLFCLFTKGNKREIKEMVLLFQEGQHESNDISNKLSVAEVFETLFDQCNWQLTNPYESSLLKKRRMLRHD